MAEQFITYRCPIDGKRLFDATPGSKFHIRTKCPQCRCIVEIDSTTGPHHRAIALLPIKNEFRKCG